MFLNKLWHRIGIPVILSFVYMFSSCTDKSKKEEGTPVKAEAPVVKKYTSKDGRFAINFPAEPKVSHDTVQTEIGVLEFHMFMLEKSVTETYLAAYSDYPSEFVKESNRDSLLNAGKKGVLLKLNGKITEEKKMKIEGNDGLLFKAVAGQVNLTYKMFIVGNRLYQIGILYDGSPVSEESIKEFFDTFELTK
ncbi:MAG: hypothetical protein ACHQRM_07170 [Bacteroidia bacterium]